MAALLEINLNFEDHHPTKNSRALPFETSKDVDPSRPVS